MNEIVNLLIVLTGSSDDTALIVGLAVGLGGGSVLCCLILLLLILILVLLFWRRKAPVVLELKEPDYLALSWNIPIVEDGNFSYQGKIYFICLKC